MLDRWNHIMQAGVGAEVAPITFVDVLASLGSSSVGKAVGVGQVVYEVWRGKIKELPLRLAVHWPQ